LFIESKSNFISYQNDKYEVITDINSAKLDAIQKILIARSVITKPKILFFEEPVDKLDKYAAGEIIDWLTDPEQPWTLVVVAKANYWKEKCTKIITIEEGRIKSIK
jgi:ABC-type bacteriocin/lantibiotic exporter with double-glycine peptidase domain